MDYKKIIYKVAKSLDPDLSITVSMYSIEEIGDSDFVVAVIHYPHCDKLIPFIIYPDSEVFMPYDWEAVLPMTADNVSDTKWVLF